MNIFEKILYFLQGKMTTPTNYGWFHLLFIVLIAFTTILLCKYLKNISDKNFRKLIFAFWIVIVILEIYKQLIFSFNYENGIVSWDYQWYAFPFQFCSVQLYLLPFVIFLKDGKVRNAIIAFLATFSLFGGLAVYAYPNDVFMSLIGINIQTMIHHGLQIILGIYFLRYFKDKLSFKSFFLPSIIVFACCVITAIILNSLAPIFTNETFNMFLINPVHGCTLPILNVIFTKVPYIIFLLIYTLGFSFVALLIFCIAKIIAKTFTKKTRIKS